MGGWAGRPIGRGLKDGRGCFHLPKNSPENSQSPGVFSIAPSPKKNLVPLVFAWFAIATIIPFGLCLTFFAEFEHLIPHMVRERDVGNPPDVAGESVRTPVPTIIIIRQWGIFHVLRKKLKKA